MHLLFARSAFSAGKSRFYGPPDFIETCRKAVSMSMEVDRALFESLMRRGIVLFPEDPQIGFFANDKYGYFSVSKEYLTYGDEGIVAVMAFIAFLQKHQVRIGKWETAIPTLSPAGATSSGRTLASDASI